MIIVLGLFHDQLSRPYQRQYSVAYLFPSSFPPFILYLSPLQQHPIPSPSHSSLHLFFFFQSLFLFLLLPISSKFRICFSNGNLSTMKRRGNCIVPQRSYRPCYRNGVELHLRHKHMLALKCDIWWKYFNDFPDN